MGYKYLPKCVIRLRAKTKSLKTGKCALYYPYYIRKEIKYKNPQAMIEKDNWTATWLDA